ncbi:helix-turn-helix transcriptional regulator [Methanosarcina sp. Mfa9]|uniref:helix-turn-helix transcriptional regulator n=1 Tax=Methanosarcina sp. Mfa9 TaxID=3439063 RepID=UPI003F8546AB
MEASLLDLVFLSEKREKILLLLREGPKSIKEIENSLNFSSTSVQPQIKILKERHLLYLEDNKYGLTIIGETIAENMRELVDTLEVLENKLDFWNVHQLEGIPPHLLTRICELKHSTFARPLDKSNMFSPHREFADNIAKSEFVKGISPFIHPLYPKMFLDFAKSGIDVSLIVTDPVFERMSTEFKPEMEQFLGLNNTHVYVCEKEILLSSAVTNCFLSLGFFYKNGTYDHVNDILCFEPEGLRWGEDLFTYYRDMSREITEI